MPRFTEEQIQEFHDAFYMFDRDNSGFLNAAQVQELLKIVGYNPTDRDLEESLIKVDINGDDKVQFPEFVTLIEMLETEEKSLKEAQDAFNAFDIMGNGFIPSNEIKEALMFVMVKSSEEVQEDIVKHFKLLPNRKIYFGEFMELITMTQG